MRVSLRSQFGIVGFAASIVLRADSGPVIKGVAQTSLAGFPHQHRFPLPATPRDGGHAGIAAESVIVSFRESRRGFREHRGGDAPTDSRQGGKEVDVTVSYSAFVRADCAEDVIDTASSAFPQIVVEAKPRQQQDSMVAGRFSSTWRETNRLADLLPLLPEGLAALETIPPRQVIRIGNNPSRGAHYCGPFFQVTTTRF